MNNYTEKEIKLAIKEILDIAETPKLPVKQWDVEATLIMLIKFLKLKQ